MFDALVIYFVSLWILRQIRQITVLICIKEWLISKPAFPI